MLLCYWQDHVCECDRNKLCDLHISRGSVLGCAHRAEMGEGGAKQAALQTSIFLPALVYTLAYCRAMLPSSRASF